MLTYLYDLCPGTPVIRHSAASRWEQLTRPQTVRPRKPALSRWKSGRTTNRSWMPAKREDMWAATRIRRLGYKVKGGI